MRSHSTEWSREAALAEEIVNVLGSMALPAYSEWRDAIRYALCGTAWKLRSIVLNRESLRRLLRDPNRAVKVEYLRRDLVRCAVEAVKYRYPRSRLAPALPPSLTA